MVPAKFEARVQEAGFRCLRLAPNNAVALVERDKRESSWRRLVKLKQRRREAVDALGVNGIGNVLAELEPDCLLIDFELHEYIISAVPRGLPVVLLSTMMSIWKRPGLPPLHRDIIPHVGWRGSRLGMELVWFRFRLWKLRRAWRQRRVCMGLDWISLLRRLAKETGFAFRKEVDLYQWQIPFSYRSLPVLCLRASELELPHSPAPQVHYVGPMINAQRPEPARSPDVDAKLESLFARRRESEAEHALIYCAFGTFAAVDKTLLRRLVEAVESRPDWDLLLGLGNQLSCEHLQPMPENVHALSWAPQLRILANADAAILHGGLNSVEECIHFGVPMLVYCCDVNDTPGNTARVLYHGLGKRGDRKNDEPETIRQRIEQVLNDDTIEGNLKRMRACVSRYASERRAEAVVTELIQDHARSQS